MWCKVRLSMRYRIGRAIVVIHMFDTDPKYRMEPSLTDNQYNWQYHNITSCVIHGSGGLVVKEADLCLQGHRFNSYQPPGVTEVLWWHGSVPTVIPSVLSSDHISNPGCKGLWACLTVPHSLPRWDSNLGLLITSPILLALSHGLLLTVVLQID